MYSSCFTLSSTNTPTHARPNHWCRQEFGGEGVFVAQQRRVCAGGRGRRRAIDLPACRLRELLPSDSTDEEKKESSGRPTGSTEHYTRTYTSERASEQASERGVEGRNGLRSRPNGVQCVPEQAWTVILDSRETSGEKRRPEAELLCRRTFLPKSNVGLTLTKRKMR